MRPSTNGPRSLMMTSTCLPVSRSVTRTSEPKSSVLCAAVSFSGAMGSPLAVARPASSRPYHEAMPCWTFARWGSWSSRRLPRCTRTGEDERDGASEKTSRHFAELYPRSGKVDEIEIADVLLPRKVHVAVVGREDITTQVSRTPFQIGHGSLPPAVHVELEDVSDAIAPSREQEFFPATGEPGKAPWPGSQRLRLGAIRCSPPRCDRSRRAPSRTRSNRPLGDQCGNRSSPAKDSQLTRLTPFRRTSPTRRGFRCAPNRTRARGHPARTPDTYRPRDGR